MNCPHCGAVIDENETKCPYCDSRLTPPSHANAANQANTNQTMTCPNCQSTISANSVFCPTCGVILKEDMQSDRATEDFREKEKAADDGKLHFSTVKDGNGYKFAAFMAYIGLPIGIITSLGVIGASENDYTIAMNMISMILSVVAMVGLRRFKKYAYKAMMAMYWVALACMIIDYFSMLDFGASFGSIVVGALIIGLCLRYFKKRKAAFCK